MIQWVGQSATHVGHVRSANEDAVLMRADMGLWAVADGMGGHAAGDVASAWIVEALASLAAQGPLAERVDLVESALVAVNAKILAYAARALAGRTMGSTVVTLLIQEDAGVCLWAGDSRLYRWRAGELTPISSDHNYAADLRDQGWPEEALVDQPKNIITRAVGVAPELFLDATLFTVQADDKFLLCSDGLTDELTDQQLSQLMVKQPDAGATSLAGQLLQAALAGRARDNISVIVVESSDL